MQAIEVAGNALSGHLSVEFLIRAAESVRAQGDAARALELLQRAVANEPASRLAVKVWMEAAADRPELLCAAVEAALSQPQHGAEDVQRLLLWRADLLAFSLEQPEEARAAYRAAAEAAPGVWAERAQAAAEALPEAPLLPAEARVYEPFGLGGLPIEPSVDLAEALETEGALAEATEVWLGLLRAGAAPAPDALRRLSKLGRVQSSGDGVCRGLAAAALADGVSLRRRAALIDKLAQALLSMGDEVSAQVLRGAFLLEEAEEPPTETGSFRPMSPLASARPTARPAPSGPLAERLKEQAEALRARGDYWAWLGFAERCDGAEQLSEAIAAFEAALECAPKPDLAARAARRGAMVAARAEEPRRAARLAARAAELEPGPEASLLLARLSTRAGDLDTAKRAWRAVLQERPGDLEATAAVLQGAAEDGARDEARRLIAAARVDGYDGPARCRWGVALARAHGQLDQLEAAEAALRQALADDPSALDPAEALVALGVRAGEAAWIDAGLSELRARAFSAGQLERAFLAAAMRVARGGASAVELEQYHTLRARRVPAPRRALSDGWVGRWLGRQQQPREIGPEPSSRSSTALSGALTRRAATLAAYFGAPAPEVAVAPGTTKLWAEAEGQPPRLELSAEAAQLSFELGRGLAALLEPTLRAGLDPTTGDPDTRTVLDRAGLLAVWDPREALAAVGPHSARGLRLIAFSVSKGMLGLSAEAGLGLV